MKRKEKGWKSSRTHACTYHVHQQHRSTTAGGEVSAKAANRIDFKDQRQGWQQKVTLYAGECAESSRSMACGRMGLHPDKRNKRLWGIR